MDLGRLLSYQGLHYIPSTDTPTINWSVRQPPTYNPDPPTHPDQDETVQWMTIPIVNGQIVRIGFEFGMDP
jgi:hypothetical protein